MAKIRKLRKSGFVRSRGGYTFPGTDQKKIKKAAFYNQLTKINKNAEKPEDPKLNIPPIDPKGEVDVAFNQDMVAPDVGVFLPPKLYDNTFGMTSESLVDGSKTTAEFSKSKKQRILEETTDSLELKGEASKLSYTPRITIHSAKQVQIKIEYDDPAQVSIGGSASVGMEIKEPSIFKSAKTLKSMSEESFDGGKPQMKNEVPPIINDPE